METSKTHLFRYKINGLLEEYKLSLKNSKEEEELLRKAKEHESDVLEAQKRLQDLAEAVQNTVHTQIAKVVSKCLKAVFNDPYEFKIIFDKKRGKTEARIVFIRDGHELDPITETGGGVVDIAAFALRIVNIIMSGLRKFIVLDEPFHFLHGAENRRRIRGLLESLSKDMGLQMLIVTQDNTDLRIGKVIELSLHHPLDKVL